MGLVLPDLAQKGPQGSVHRLRRLALVSWLPPWQGWDDAMLYLFELSVAEDEVAEGSGGAFFVAEVDGEPRAMGAYRAIAEIDGAAEVKRMYALTSVRGLGLGAAVLSAPRTPSSVT